MSNRNLSRLFHQATQPNFPPTKTPNSSCGRKYLAYGIRHPYSTNPISKNNAKNQPYAHLWEYVIVLRKKGVYGQVGSAHAVYNQALKLVLRMWFTLLSFSSISFFKMNEWVFLVFQQSKSINSRYASEHPL